MLESAGHDVLVCSVDETSVVLVILPCLWNCTVDFDSVITRVSCFFIVDDYRGVMCSGNQSHDLLRFNNPCSELDLGPVRGLDISGGFDKIAVTLEPISPGIQKVSEDPIWSVTPASRSRDIGPLGFSVGWYKAQVVRSSDRFGASSGRRFWPTQSASFALVTAFALASNASSTFKYAATPCTCVRQPAFLQLQNL